MEEKLTQEYERLAELLSLHNQMEGLDRAITDKISLRRQMAIRSGELLIDQRKLLKGKFVKWVQEKLPYTIRTAQRYINRAQGKGDKLSRVELAEDYVALTDPGETQEDLDAMRVDWLKNREKRPDKEEGEQKPSHKEESRHDIEPTEDQSGTGETRDAEEGEDADDDSMRFLKLGEKGEWGDATINDVIETVELARKVNVQDTFRKAKSFLLKMNERGAVKWMQELKGIYGDLLRE